MAKSDTETLTLLDVLPLILIELEKDKESLREIDDVLAENYKIQRGTFGEILINNERLLQLPSIELNVISCVLFDITKDDRINPKNFMSDRDYNKALKYRGINAAPIYPIVLQPVLVSPDGTEYQVCMSYKDIANLYTNKIVTYNFNSQRLSKKKLLKSGKVSEKIDIKQKSVNEIADLMENGKYKADTIVLSHLRHIQYYH